MRAQMTGVFAFLLIGYKELCFFLQTPCDVLGVIVFPAFFHPFQHCRLRLDFVKFIRLDGHQHLTFGWTSISISTCHRLTLLQFFLRKSPMFQLYNVWYVYLHRWVPYISCCTYNTSSFNYIVTYNICFTNCTPFSNVKICLLPGYRKINTC